MSLVNLAHVCSHLQNVSKARLAVANIPYTKLHLDLMLALQKQGFFSHVTPGGLACPEPLTSTTTTFIPDEADDIILDTNTTTTTTTTTATTPPTPLPQQQHQLYPLPSNPAERRIWLGMKYWRNEPVLSRMRLISKPTKRVMLSARELDVIARGRERGYVKGLNKIGECIFVKTVVGVLEARECVERRTGGLILCRSW